MTGSIRRPFRSEAEFNLRVTLSAAEPFSGNLSLRIVLSADQTITADDLRLSRPTLALEGTSQSVRFNIRVRDSVAPGSYFVGVLLETEGDANAKAVYQ